MSRKSQSTTPDERQPPAVVLLSGGLDSATVLAIARAEGYSPYALTVRYGQRHEVELAAARAVAMALGAERHLEIDADLGSIGGSALTDDIDVPSADDPDRPADGIPITYVPARNTVLLALALSWSEVLEAEHIFLGVNAVDYSGYPDCRPDFLDAFQKLARVATRAGVGGAQIQIHAPLLHFSKAEIIRRGIELGVDYALTTSCYDPGQHGTPCRRCEACQLRAAGFDEAGLDDPARVDD